MSERERENRFEYVCVCVCVNNLVKGMIISRRKPDWLGQLKKTSISSLI